MPSAYTYPGVYVEEVPSGVRTITGVSTSNTAFVDFFARGPMNEAVQVTSLADFNRRFEALTGDQRKAICDDICFEPKAKPEHKKLARFFDKFRDLTASAYYATPPGWKAIGYVGNTPLVEFTGPPPEVLERLGLS